jgi:hypothetical protein
MIGVRLSQAISFDKGPYSTQGLSRTHGLAEAVEVPYPDYIVREIELVDLVSRVAYTVGYLDAFGDVYIAEKAH